MKRGIFIMVLASVLLVSPFILAGNFIAFQGNVKEGGVGIGSGNLSVIIYNSQTGGSAVYNSGNDFNGTISDGEYDVMLGNGSNELILNYGTKYYLEMYVNGEQFSFNGNSRQVFESAVGNISYVNLQNNIPASYINKSTGTSWVGINLATILDTIYSWIGAVNTTENIRGLGFYNTSQIDSMTDGINTTENIEGLGFNTTAQLDNKYVIGSESNLNVNSSTWWGGVSGWVSNWFIKSGNNLELNESKLNATITALATAGSGDITSVNTSEGGYIYNGSNSGDVYLAFNETKLNDSMDNRGILNNWSSTYNATYDAGAVGNLSWNQTLASSLYAPIGAGNVSFNQTLTDSLYAPIGAGNVSWNETHATSLFAKLLGGNIFSGDQEFNGGWASGGLSIIGGNLFAQTLYVYNITSLAVNELNINGSLLPATGFSNTFDLGSSNSSWRDLYLGGDANVSGSIATSGNLTIGEKITFALGGVIDNIVDGWIRVTENINVSSGNLSLGGKLLSNENGTLMWGGVDVDTNVSVLHGVNDSGGVVGLSVDSDRKLNLKITSLSSGVWEVVGGVTRLVSPGNVNISGTLTVYGDANVTGDLYVGGDVNVTGNVSLGSKITFTFGEMIENIVGGIIKITGDLNVLGEVNVSGNLTVRGNVGVGTDSPDSKLDVNGSFIRTIAHNSSNGPPETIDSGQLTSRVLGFTKEKESSEIRISYTDTFRVQGASKACTYDIKVGGAQCPSQNLSYNVYNANVDVHRPNTFVGYCKGVSAGEIEIQVWVRDGLPVGGGDCYTGYPAYTWVIEAEEVY